MAFIEKNMTFIGPSNAEKTGSGNVGAVSTRDWRYSTADGNTTVRINTYFDNSIFAKKAAKGDLVRVTTFNSPDWETDPSAFVISVQNMIVMSADGTSVDLSNGTSIGASNTD